MPSSAGARAAVGVEADHDLSLDIPRSLTLHEDEALSLDHGGHNEEEEERLQAQREMQMLDLGTGRREYVTSHDKPIPRELRVSKEQLLRARKVNEEGTDAAKWYQQNKEALNAWNNIGSQIANDHADREELADLMGGQSHRARLNKDIREQGGQEYGELSIVEPENHTRRGKKLGIAVRGMPGRSGRGAPMHVPVSRTTERLFPVAPPPIATGLKTNRPLDPAVDPDREYRYKSRRRSKTCTMSHSGGPAVRVGETPSRGTACNDARATMEGCPVRIRPAAPQSRPERTQPERAQQMAPVTMALNDQAFLRVLNGMKTKPAFNDHVQEKSKPAPASKAAALVEKPAKNPKKTSSGLVKSSETPAEAFKNLEARAPNQPPQTDVGSIRLAPTHEFVFPPPITKSGGKKTHSSNVSVHTDGVESAVTYNSADFETLSMEGVKTDPESSDVTIVIGSKLTEKASAARSEAKPGINGLGINVLPPACGVESKPKDDLIVLDQDTGHSPPVAKASRNDGPVASNGIYLQSPSIPDIMDEELDFDIPQTTLTPKSSLTPRCISYRGVRYIRADQVTGQDLEPPFLHATHQGVQINSSHMAISNRVPATSRPNIGIRTLQESNAGSILGEHNQPGRSRGGTETSSTNNLQASKWAAENVQATGPTVRRSESSVSHIRASRKHESSVRNADRDGIEMTDASANPFVEQKLRPCSNLAASKYATPDAHVITSQVPLVQAATIQEPAGSLSMGHMQNGAASSAAEPHNCQDRIQAHETHREVDRTTAALKPFDKAQNLNALEWANLDSEVIKSLDGRNGQSRPPSDPSEDIGGTFNPVTGSQNGGLRKRNPFGTLPKPFKPTESEPDSKSSTMVPVQPGDADVINERVDGTTNVDITPLVARDRTVRETRSGMQAGPSTSNSSIPSQRVHVPLNIEAPGNSSSRSHSPLTMDERLVQAMRSVQTAGWSGHPRPASPRPTKCSDSCRLNFAVEDRHSGPGVFQNRPKPMMNLMASKYATEALNSSAFRVMRGNQAEVSSDESDL